MKTRVILKPSVLEFLQALAPEPRKKMVRALKDLSEDKGDIKQLEKDLAPFWRLRVGRHRVIFKPRVVAGERHMVCIFAETRATVYAMMGQLLAAGLRSDD